MRHLLLATATAAAALLAAVPAAAQDTASAPPSAASMGGDRLTVGLGVASVPDYEGADTNDWIPAAAAIGSYKGYEFFTRGTQLYVDLAKDADGVGNKFELGVIGAFRLERTNNIDNRQVRALGEIDTAYEVGGFVGVGRQGVITSDFDTLTARVAVVQDVSGTHKSYVVTPQVTYTTPLSYSTLVSIGASADYVGKGYGRTYYSVTPLGTARSGLRTYDAADAGWKAFNLSAFAIQSLTGDLRKGLGVGAGVLYGRMLGDFKRSPLVRDVGDKDQWYYAAGLTYSF